MEIYLASILLEKNRWAPVPRRPACRFTDWLPRIAAAGFNGIELWENHWMHAGIAARHTLAASPVPIRLFNSYISPATADPTEIASLAEALQALGPSVRGIKFNLADHPASADAEIDAATKLAAQLPAQVRLYCECHADSVVDSPASAAAAFARWPRERFGAILHPLHGDDAAFSDWLQCLGSFISHLHLQIRDEQGKFIGLVNRPRIVRQRLRVLLGAGFAGSMSLEFTGGTGLPEEDEAVMWQRTQADLALVREILADHAPS